MICRNCGTEIADKAIVCYRCGTGTTEPLRKPADLRRRRTPVWTYVLVIVVLLISLLLARSYHLFGLEVLVVEGPDWYVSILIDFPPLHA